MPRILVVDDEESIRITIKEFLTDAGHEVQIAEDAITALELLKKTDFDVIVTDIILPRMSGVKLLKAIRDISKHVQVIMITGEPTIDTASDALRLGAFDYLAKPVTKEAIVRTVNNAAATKTLVDEKLRLEEDNLNYQKNLEKLVDKRTEDLWKSQHELKVRNRILEIFVSSPDDQLYSDILEYVLKLLKSEFGTFGYFGENGKFVVPAMTRKIFWDKCNVPEKEMIFNEGDFGGIWRKVIADRQTGFDNRGPFNVPEGHIEIFNTLVTPIVFKDELISAIHVANKRGGYDENDKILIETISSLIAPYLYNKLEKEKSEKSQKRTANELLIAAENWKTTFDAIEDLVGLISPDCEFVEVNKAMCDFTGLSPAELKGRKCYEIIHGTNDPIANCPVDKAKQSLKSETSEIFQDGNYYAVSASPVIGENGRITGFTHIVKDITDQKIAEQTLKVERDKAKQYLKIAEVMMLALDTEGQVVMINKKGCDILGYEEEKIIGKNWFDLCIPPETTREVKIVFDNLINGNYDPVEYYENEILTKYQERRVIAFHNSVIRNETDEIIGTLASGDDITERKQAVEKIRKLSLAVEQSPSIVVITDPEGVIEYANPRFSQTTGYNSEEAIGEKIESLGEQSGELQKEMWDILISGQEWKGEFYNMRKGGELYWESASISSIKNSEGIITNFIKVAEDITERKLAEKALQRSEHLLKEAQAVAHIGHWELDPEVGTPVWSDEVFRIFGLNPQEGEPSFVDHETHIHPEEWPILDEAVTRLSAEGGSFDIEFRIERPDNTIAWMHAIGNTIRNEKGQVSKLFGTAQDVTHRKLTEEKVVQSKILLESSIESQKDMIILSLDTEYRYLFFNKTHAESMAQIYASVPQVGDCIFDFMKGEDDIKIVKAHYDRALVGESHTAIEEYGEEGSCIYYEIRYNPIYDKNNTVIGITAYAADITERRKAEKELLESRENWRSVTETSPDHILMLDTDLKIQFVNYTAPGLTIKDVKGKLLYELVDKSDQNRVRKILEGVLKSGEEASYETEYDVPEGSKMYFETRAGVRRLHDQVVGLTVSSRDITQRKQAEEALSISEAFLNNVIEQSPESLWISDDEGTLIRLNQACCDLLGATEEEAVGKYNILKDNVIVEQGFMPLVEDVFKKGEIARFTIDYDLLRVEHVKVGGARHRILDVIISPIKDLYGTVTNVLVLHKDITERKNAEEKVRKSEAFLNQIIEQSPYSIWISDVEGTLIRINPKCCEVLKITEEAVLGKYNIFNDNIVIEQGFLPKVKEAFEEGHVVNFTIKWNAAELKNIDLKSVVDLWIDVTIFPILDESGNLVNAVIQHLDVTERIVAQEMIRKSEETYRTLTENMKEVVFVTDNQGEITFITSSATKMFGYTPEEIIGKRVTALLSEEDIPKGLAAFKNAIESGSGDDGVIFNIKRKDGSTFFGELHSTVSRANGEIIGTQGMVRDVTDRKEAEEALRESDERFRQVAEQAQEWIWEVDRNGLYTYASPVIEKILGYKPEDIVGQKHFYDLFYPDDLKELKKAALQSFAEKESFRGLVNRNVHADGSVVWMDTSGTPILDENGDLLGYRGADTDITQRVLAEKELRELNDTLEAAQKMAKVGYWRFDIESQLPTWSDQMFDVCGYKKEDGVPSYEEHKLTWHSDDWGFFDEAVQACTQGTPYNVVVRIKFRDGTYHFVNTQGFPVYDDKGEIKELFGTSQDITELKQAEEVIRQSEVAYRTLTENMRDVIFATDNQGEITFITSSTSDVFGCKPEDMIGRRFTAFLTEEDVPKALAAFRNAIDSSSEDDTLILNMKRKDGTTFYGELRSNVLRINGSITGTQGMIRDITTRKVAEEALIEREESLEEAQEFAKIGSWEMDTDTKKIVWSKQMYRMLEVSPDQEPTFELYFSRVHPDDLEYVQEVGARVYENNEAAIAEYRLLTPSGIIMIVATSGHQILDVENNVIILKGIVQDITERKQAEKELEIQKAYLEELFESAPEAIVILDNEDRIERVNREFTNLFGYLPSEAIDKKINDLVVPEDMKGEGLKATFDARDGKIFALETVRQKKNGERIHVSIIGHPIKIGEEQLAVYGIYRDITNRRKAELALQESMERLKGFDQHSTEGVFRIDMLKPVPVDLSRTETIKWFDEHAVIGEVNDSLARMYGLTPKEMIGRKVVDFAPNSGERAFLVLENDNYRVTNEETEDVDNDGNTISLIENYHGIVEDGHLHAIWGAQSNITERKRAEAAVIESEDRYRNLIEGSYDLVQSVSPDGKFSIVNKAWLDALGYRKEELEDMSAFDVVHQDSILHCQEIFERVLKGESVKNFETTFITKNGKMMLLEGKAVPRIKGDKIIGTQSFFRDITDQKRVEQELKQWGHIFKNAQLGIAVSDSDGNKIEISNPYFEKLVGYKSLEPNKLPVSDLFPTEYHEDLKEQISIINKMGYGSFESTIQRKDGSNFPAQIDATAVRDDKGNFMYRVVNLQDITTRKRDEEKLHEYSTSLERMVSDRTAELEKARRHAEDSRDQIDTILKSVSDGLVVTDLENKIVLLNSAAESILSVKMTEVIGSKIDLAIKNETLRERLHGVFGKKISEYEFDFEMPEMKNGKKQIFNARTSIIFDRKNFKAGMVTIMQDVTIEREVDRMKTEFVSTAAHELRTPLTSIQGFSEVLITRDDLNIEEKLRFLTYINTQSINLSAIINDLLDVSRIESGKGFELVKQQVDIIRSIREIVNLFKDRSTKHRFKTHLPKREILLLLDNEKILQVFENLLSNATKYSPDGGEIQIKGKVEGDQFKITIKDQGIGMTPDQVGRIYEKFYRADASNTAFEGTGLGMTIVKHIIESHGGTVWAESEINRGTILGIALPMAIR